MLFHLGSVIRLNEAGVLGHVKRISSVSGGSITAGLLGLRWASLGFAGGSAPAARLEKELVEPICNLAGRAVDTKSVLWVQSFQDRRFPIASPQLTISFFFVELRWPICRTTALHKPLGLCSTQPTYRLARFGGSRVPIWATTVLDFESAPHSACGGSRSISRIPSGTVALLLWISKFRPMRSPPDRCRPRVTPPYTTRVVLTDGGVYDNLGLETVFKRYTTVLVSDGGMKISAEPEPYEDWGAAFETHTRSDRQPGPFSAQKAAYSEFC